MWWSLLTMTTVGYGDKYPLSVLGKILACFTAFCGIATIAMPSAILGFNFQKVYEDEEEKEKVEQLKEQNFAGNEQTSNLDE